MKSVRPSLFLSALLTVAAFTQAGCLKTDEMNTLPVIEPSVPSLYLHFVDKKTGGDLFFGPDATYRLSEIGIYNIINDTVDHSYVRSFRIDSAKDMLFTRFDYPFSMLKIADLPGDTISAVSSNHQKAGREFIDTILLNGRKLAADADNAFTILK